MPRSRIDPALGVLMNSSQWTLFVGPTGRPLFLVPGSKGGTYTANGRSCTCPSDQWRVRSGQPCKHVRAIRMYTAVVKAHLRHQQQAQEAIRGDT